MPHLSAPAKLNIQGARHRARGHRRLYGILLGVVREKTVPLAVSGIVGFLGRLYVGFLKMGRGPSCMAIWVCLKVGNSKNSIESALVSQHHVAMRRAKWGSFGISTRES